MDLITQVSQIVNLLPPKDISAAAFSTAYVNMKLYRHVDFLITTGANGAGTKAVTLKEAINKSGGNAATLVLATPVNHYYTNQAAASSASLANDTFVKTTLSSGTFNIPASIINCTFVLPVDSDRMTLNASASSAQNTHLGIGIATTGAACIVGAVAILSQPRYQQAAMPTALD